MINGVGNLRLGYKTWHSQVEPEVTHIPCPARGHECQSRRSLDGAELAKRNPGSSNHNHRLGHSDRQLAKVDSDAKEGAGRNDDQGRTKATRRRLAR